MPVELQNGVNVPSILQSEDVRIRMKKDSLLSDEIQSFIATLDSEGRIGDTPEERKANQNAQKFINIIVDDLISSREGLTDSKLAVFDQLVHSTPELVADLLDNRFARNVIDAVPGYVQRIMQLSRVEGTTIPSEVTNGYMREAVRTYVFGLAQASVALSRAALEQAIKEKLGMQLSGDFISFQNLLSEAKKWHILGNDVMELWAQDVANAGDDVMHDRPTTLSTALEVLDKLRGLFRHIYSTEGHY
jgi:hypothetical protein